MHAEKNKINKLTLISSAATYNIQ